MTSDKRLTDEDLVEVERETKAILKSGVDYTSPKVVASLASELRAARAALAAFAKVEERAKGLDADDRITQVPTYEWEEACRLTRELKP